MVDFTTRFDNYVKQFNNYLDDFFSSLDTNAPELIKKAMKYAVVDGGKRIRPVLFFAACDVLNIDYSKVKEFAIALELIHSYSLVHDDLPAMDNDDFRRGKFSTHKQFGEANGILTGDALLTLAFEVCLSKENFNSFDAAALKVLANAAGYSGMVAGQVLDLAAEGEKDRTEALLLDIYENKTSKLLIAPLLMASSLSGGKYFDELKTLGYNLGIMFQFTDDILDVEGSIDSIGKTPHKDEKSEKFTSVSLFGLEGAKERNKNYFEQCFLALDKIPNSNFLRQLVEYIYKRKS